MADSWGVSEEAIAALLNLAEKIEEEMELIKKETANLKTVFEDNQSGLGPHASSIKTLLDDIESAEQEGSKPVKKLVLKLNRAAAIRAKVLADNRYLSGRSR